MDFDQHGVHEATIYDGLSLDPGMTFAGPAVVQEPAVSLVVSPGHKVKIDDFGNYHIAIVAEG